MPLLESNRGEKEVIVLIRKNGEELQIRPKNLRVNLAGGVVDNLKEILGMTKAYLAPANRV